LDVVGLANFHHYFLGNARQNQVRIGMRVNDTVFYGHETGMRTFGNDSIPDKNCFKSIFFFGVVVIFVLFLAVLLISLPQLNYESLGSAKVGMGSLGALPVSLVVFAIGLSLGGTTGYAINPARDFGPRIIHSILPIKNKDGNDWQYAWIPVVGPVVGAGLAAGIYLLINFMC